MQPTKELIDQLYREKILRARQQNPEDKFFAGAELFGMACRIASDAIRNQYPEADEAKVRELLRRRIQIMERLDAIP